MFKWFKKRREKKINDIANAVVQKLDDAQGWEKFLPPVAMRDNVYMMTESGTVYVMKWDHSTDMEMFMKIRDRY